MIDAVSRRQMILDIAARFYDTRYHRPTHQQTAEDHQLLADCVADATDLIDDLFREPSPTDH